jgi:hypothetical protein
LTWLNRGFEKSDMQVNECGVRVSREELVPLNSHDAIRNDVGPKFSNAMAVDDATPPYSHEY